MKQEKRLAIIKASIESLEERYSDLDWEAFKKGLPGLTTKPLQESLKEELNSLLFTVIIYTWQNQSKLEKALNI